MRAALLLIFLLLAPAADAASWFGLRDHNHTGAGQGGAEVGPSTLGIFTGADATPYAFADGSHYLKDLTCSLGTNCTVDLYFMGPGATANDFLFRFLIRDNTQSSLTNMVNGSATVLAGEDTGGVGRDMLRLDPDGSFGGTLFPCRIVKTASTARNTTTTIADDPDLDCTGLVAAGYYRWELHAPICDAGGGIDMQIRATAGAVLQFTYSYPATTTTYNLSAQETSGGSSTFNVTAANLSSTCDQAVHATGMAYNTDSIAFGWAQDTSSGANTIVDQGAYLIVERIL